MSTVDEELVKIKAKEDHLNRICDEAAAVVRRVEEFLQKVGVGECHASHLFEGGKLEWRRFGKKYHVIAHWTNGDGCVEISPWFESKRTARLATFPHLPGLLENMTKNIESMVQKTEVISPIITSLNEALNACGKPTRKKKCLHKYCNSFGVCLDCGFQFPG